MGVCQDGDGDDDDDDGDDDNHFVDQAHLDGEQAPIFPKWVSWVQQLAEALSGHLDFDLVRFLGHLDFGQVTIF